MSRRAAIMSHLSLSGFGIAMRLKARFQSVIGRCRLKICLMQAIFGVIIKKVFGTASYPGEAIIDAKG